ncbi:hypothetical protein [Pseudoneobacillus sp. C159]
MKKFISCIVLVFMFFGSLTPISQSHAAAADVPKVQHLIIENLAYATFVIADSADYYQDTLQVEIGGKTFQSRIHFRNEDLRVDFDKFYDQGTPYTIYFIKDGSNEKTLVAQGTVGEGRNPQIEATKTIQEGANVVSFRLLGIDRYAFANIPVGVEYNGKKYYSRYSSEGRYDIFLNTPLTSGQTITYFIEYSGDEIYKLGSTTVIDTTPPSQAEVNVYQTTIRDTKVAGYVKEDGMTINVYIGKNKYSTKTIKTKDEELVSFSIKIPKQKANTTYYVEFIDKSGNKSKFPYRIATIDNGVYVNYTYAYSTNVTGRVNSYQSGDYVQVLAGTKKYTATVNKNGTFSVKIPKQKAGASIVVRNYDSINNLLGSSKEKIYLGDKVKIGMTKAQVLLTTWGKPLRVNTTVTSNITHEQWVYYGNKYLYFTNGKLTLISI